MICFEARIEAIDTASRFSKAHCTVAFIYDHQNGQWSYLGAFVEHTGTTHPDINPGHRFRIKANNAGLDRLFPQLAALSPEVQFRVPGNSPHRRTEREITML